jgi:hypothetical protein
MRLTRGQVSCAGVKIKLQDGKSFWASAMLRGEARALVSIDLRGNVRQALQGEKPYIGWAIPSRDGKHLAMWQSTGGSNAWMLEGF